MKALLTLTALALLALTSGCWTSGSRISPQGGIPPENEEFSITVPTATTLQQGADTIVVVLLNRGDYFKQDVQLDMSADGIGVIPTNVLVKASDRPEVKFQLVVPREAAIGSYRVTAKATPVSGRSATAAFTVAVVSQ